MVVTRDGGLPITSEEDISELFMGAVQTGKGSVDLISGKRLPSCVGLQFFKCAEVAQLAEASGLDPEG